MDACVGVVDNNQVNCFQASRELAMAAIHQRNFAMNNHADQNTDHWKCIEHAAATVLRIACGVQANRKEPRPPVSSGEAVAALVPLAGNLECDLFLSLPRPTATALAKRLAGFDIPLWQRRDDRRRWGTDKHPGRTSQACIGGKAHSQYPLRAWLPPCHAHQRHSVPRRVAKQFAIAAGGPG
jgi:hypothetical protein